MLPPRRDDDGGLNAALVLSGHLRRTCSDAEAWRGLAHQVSSCRSAFGVCDVFLHAWATNDVAFDHQGRRHRNQSAWDCAGRLASAFGLAAVTISQQDLHHTASDHMRSRRWGNTTYPFAGVKFNLIGQQRAVELMRSHGAAMQRTYHAAVRMRPDIADRRIAKVTNVSSQLWSVVRDWARAARRADLRGAAARVAHTCRPDRSLGGSGTDNCYWSAPPEALAGALQVFGRDAQAFEQISPPSNTDGCVRVQHPESLLRCVLPTASVIGRPLETLSVSTVRYRTLK